MTLVVQFLISVLFYTFPRNQLVPGDGRNGKDRFRELISWVVHGPNELNSKYGITSVFPFICLKVANSIYIKQVLYCYVLYLLLK